MTRKKDRGLWAKVAAAYVVIAGIAFVVVKGIFGFLEKEMKNFHP